MADPYLSVSQAAAALAVALGCGLMIGIERERRKGSGPGRGLGGVRTFALASVSGAAAMLVATPWLALIGAAFVAALAVSAYLRDTSGDPGVTTEIALLLTYLIGVLCTWSLPLAAALAVGVTALLEAREGMHHFANHWLRPGELRDGILLAALVLIAMPLMPDRAYWGPVFNPHVITQLLALLLGIQAVAHLSRRLLQARHALALSAVASGFVSSTATIATMGLKAREGEYTPRAMAGAGLLSCVATMLQLLVVAAAVQPSWLRLLWAPCLAGAAVAAAWGWLLLAGLPGGAAPDAESRAAPVADEDRMFILRHALLIALLLSGIQVAVYALGLWLGTAGLFAGTIVASLADLHAAATAVLVQAPVGTSKTPVLLSALMLALSVHAVSKSVTASVSGGRAYALLIVPALLAHTAVAVAGLAWFG